MKAPAGRPPRATPERRTLRALLAINGAMSVGEALAGWWAQPTGLLAGFLDMPADAAVSGIARLARRPAGGVQALHEAKEARRA